jgi:TonB family protein
MNKRMAFFALAFLLAFGGPALAKGEAEPQATAEQDIRLRFFEGIKEGAAEPAQVITSSFLHSTITANIASEEDLAEEQKQIKKTFNLDDVKLLTEAVLKWPAKGSNKVSHLLRLDSNQYLILVTPLDRIRMRQFRVEIFELSNEKKTSLLDTEVILPARNIAVFGFEDMRRKPYFLALRVPQAGILGGVEGGVLGGVEGGVEGGVKGGVVGGVKGGVVGGVEGGVAGAAGETKTPRLIKKVNPVYPEIARQAGVEGVVILEVKTDTNGRVHDARILRSIPLLDQAAIDAVKQWVYEPLVIDGVPRPATFTVTVRFRLDGEKAAKTTQAIEEFAKGAVKVTGDIELPKLIKKVDPVYPEIARTAGVEGLVIVQARIDISGKVKDVMVLRSIPLLDQAAIDAVSQWVYEPMIIKGKPMEAVFTVTVRFALEDNEKKAALKKTSELEKGAVRATGEINPPRLVKKVEPIYPEEARKAGIEGIVILETMTDEKGNIARVKVLKSIPELDQAAMDALKQWKYEPTIIDGKATPIVFTVTIRFKLK